MGAAVIFVGGGKPKNGPHIDQNSSPQKFALVKRVAKMPPYSEKKSPFYRGTGVGVSGRLLLSLPLLASMVII